MHRSQVLTSIQQIADEFVKHVCKAQNKPAHIMKEARAKIMPFGSFKLGVIGPGSDIDTLVVTPKYVTKDDFFTVLPQYLYKMAPEGAITEFTPRPEAFAPIIAFKYSGVDIDLLFGRIASLDQIPKDFDLRDDKLLQGLTASEVVCVNGVRVATETLALVPEASVFRTALRVIKLWSARRAISGNMFGFPGGIVWALLVARICQLYPKATSSTVVLKFFRIMEKWQWPTPIILKPIENHHDLGLKIWNPKVGLLHFCVFLLTIARFIPVIAFTSCLLSLLHIHPCVQPTTLPELLRQSCRMSSSKVGQLRIRS